MIQEITIPENHWFYSSTGTPMPIEILGQIQHKRFYSSLQMNGWTGLVGPYNAPLGERKLFVVSKSEVQRWVQRVEITPPKFDDLLKIKAERDSIMAHIDQERNEKFNRDQYRVNSINKTAAFKRELNEKKLPVGKSANIALMRETLGMG